MSHLKNTSQKVCKDQTKHFLKSCQSDILKLDILFAGTEKKDRGKMVAGETDADTGELWKGCLK